MLWIICTALVILSGTLAIGLAVLTNKLRDVDRDPVWRALEHGQYFTDRG